MSAHEPSRHRSRPATNYDESYYDFRSAPKRRQDQRARGNHTPRSARYAPSDYSQSETATQRAPPAGSEYSYHASAEPAPAEDQYQLTPYDDEKAYAEYSRVYGPPSPEETYDSPPRRRRRNSYDDHRPSYRDRRARFPDDRSDDLMTYDRHGRPYDGLSVDRGSMIYDDRDSRYDGPCETTSPKEKEENGKSDLKSSLIGGASGAYLGNRLVGKGALGTLGGAIAGAIGVNAMEYFDKKRHRKEEKDRRRRVGAITKEAMEDTPRSNYRTGVDFPGDDAPPRRRYVDWDLRRPPQGAKDRRRSRRRHRSLSADRYRRY